MEFSFFWILLSLTGYAAFYCGQFLLRPLIKRKRILYALIPLSAAVLFLNPLAGAALLAVLSAVFLFTVVFKSKKSLFAGLQFFFFFFLLVFCVIYLPKADGLWENLNAEISVLIKPALKILFRFLEVFYVAQYFRYVFPSIAAAGTALLLCFILDKHPRCFFSRFLIRFNHKQVFALIGFWIIFGLFEFAMDFFKLKAGYLFFIEAGLLNICLYFSFYYMIYGFMLLLFILKKKGIMYLISFLIIYGSLILSGGFIVYPLIFLMGIGISDIWMDYTKKKIKISPVQ